MPATRRPWLAGAASARSRGADAAGDQAGGALAALGDPGLPDQLGRLDDLDFDGADLAAQRFGFIKVNAHMLHEYADHNSVANLRGNLSRLGIDLIVEKIESEDILTDLRQLGITYGQGFLFGEPRAARIQNDR